MIKISKVFLLFSFILASTVAFADSFSGPYGGLTLGYIAGTDKGVEHDPAPDGYTQKTKPSGALFGGLLGYDMRLKNRIVLGIEGDVELRMGNSNAVQFNGTTREPQYPVKTVLREAYSVRPRLGYVLDSGRTMAYATAGFASAGFRRTYSDTSGPTNQSDFRQQNGWTAGLGAEHLLTDKLALRLEARYSDLGKQDNGAGTVYGAAYRERQAYHESTLRAALLLPF